MIDVVFLLLVFFVCASIGQTPDSLLPAQLTSGDTEASVEVAEPDPLEFESPEIRIRLSRSEDAQLQIEMNEAVIATPSELHSRLTRLADVDSGSRIILDVADDVSVQQFIAVYDRCQALAFESISFAVRTP